MSAIAATLEPKSAEELAGAVRETAAENLALAPVGSATMLGLGNPPERSDLTISMRGLRRIVDYEPEDQVIVVEGGMTLGELQATLAEKRQRLAIDPPGGDAMTVGGMLATNAYGPSAMRYGTLKDLIVGIEIVRADGAIARAGGKVVKNVAGFDVSKLMVGSLGTLAIVTKATFRLHPLPETSCTLAFKGDVAGVFPFVLALREAQLEPSAIVARIDAGSTTIDVRFEGFGPGVTAQTEKCTQIALEQRLSGAPEGRGVEGRAPTLKATFPPSEFARVAAKVDSAVVFPSLGVMFFSARDDTEKERISIQELRTFFESLGGTLVVQAMPAQWRGKVDAWGAPPPAFGLMRALKERFDPARRLNPGRFVGGL